MRTDSMPIFPYETENVQAAGIRNWGNEFLTSPKGGRIRSYTVTAGDNAVKSWTTAAAKLFTTAQNEDGNPEAVREVPAERELL